MQIFSDTTEEFIKQLFEGPIIVEGIDRAGKSTLTELIQKLNKFKIFHDEYKPFYVTHSDFNINNEKEKNLFEEITSIKFNFALQFIELFDTIIIDRFHLTEKVYNHFRGQPFKNYDYVDKKLNEINAFLILVVPDDIEESSRQHGSDLSKHHHLFKTLFHESEIKNKLMINQSTVFKMKKEINKWIK